MMLRNCYWLGLHRDCKNNQVIVPTSKLGFLLAAMIPLCFGSILLYPDSSMAQRSDIKQQHQITTKTIYVDPNRGNDTASGSQVSPLKTITQALRIAQPNTTISLAPGTYSEATGEVFPLIIKTNITLQGTPVSQGHNTIIQGSGSFISPTGAGQNVTIAAIKDAGAITGVTVKNPHTRGHGLWIESANPKVTHNTFTRNGNTGVSVNGKGNPVIANNYFYLNLGNGLLVYGICQPQVIDNEFEKTGFGVSIVQNAAPTLVRNSFSDNRISVIFEGNSQGVLRSNKINNSSEYGLVAIANSRVDLGTTTQPGENTFYNSGKFDIQNTTSNPIPAVGTEVTGQIQGNIDFSGATDSPVIASSKIAEVAKAPVNNSFSRLRQFPLKERNIAKQPDTNPDINTVSSSAIGNEETLPPPPEITNPVTNTSTNPVTNTSTNPVTNSPTRELVFSAPSEEIALESNTLPVPNIEPPSSPLPNPNNNRQISSLSDLLSPYNTNSSNNLSRAEYRVLVEVRNNNQKAQVRSRYPEAFTTLYRGKSMLQVGAFSNRSNAETISRSLADLGLKSYVIDF